MESFLIAFGFTEKEAEVYQILLEQGTSSVTELSDLLGIKRSSCQEHLRALVEKGFVNFTRVGKRHAYQAEDPDKFRQIIFERRFFADRLTMELERLERSKRDWEASVVDRVQAEKKVRRLRKEKKIGEILEFGTSKASGVVHDRGVILISDIKEIPAIEINSEEIADLHRAILKKR